ncbi:MAG: hypothetical protein JW929_14735 [Anaerolineales bacterium]|nr:hypothetical protein [Anaerolineales bacterium]
MTEQLTLEFAVFLLVLLAIAAAFDLWLIRAWKRRRRHPRSDGDGKRRAGSPAQRSGGNAGEPPNKTAVRCGPIPPASTPPRKPAVPGSQAASDDSPAREAFPLTRDMRSSKSKRGAKTVSQKESLAAPSAKTGRTTHVNITMDLPEGESIRVTLESSAGGTRFVPEAQEAAARLPSGAAQAARTGFSFPAVGSWVASFLRGLRPSAGWLFTLALVLYLLTRLIGLTRWPIYFFTDEAVQTNFAAELVNRGFVWSEEEAIPVFFENAGQYEMNLSVYVQLIPYLLFGKSAFVTRAVSALITLLAAAGVAWILKYAFRLPLWWSGVLLLSIVPMWFLHSRTAFEPGEAIAFYAMFLFFYSRYRDGRPWMLIPALVLGAMAAYTYSPMQVAMAVTGALLLLSDFPYHLRHWRTALAGLAVLMILAIPYLWFLHVHPDANRDQLVIVSSYWVDEVPLGRKLGMFFDQYLRGLDPRYWYLADPPEGVHHDIVRHLMKGYGHIALWSLPFAAAGLLLCLVNIGKPPFRLVLAALLAAPTGGAVAQITISRTLVMTIPATLLTALGVSWLLALLERPEDPPLPEFLEGWKALIARLAGALPALRDSLAARIPGLGLGALLREWRERTAQIAAASPGLARFPRTALALALFLLLGSANVYMLWDALTHGPTWYQNYELYGMQYGGEQLCAALEQYRLEHPEANLIVSSSWANGSNEIFDFFLPPGFAYRTGTVLEYIQEYIPIGPQDVFVMTSEEYHVALDSGRFSDVRILQTLEYPNGQPGFYFARLTYAAGIEEIIAAEKAELAKPVDETILLGGESVRVVHSRFDMGTLAAGFDGDLFSLMRTQSANPMVLEMYFPAAHAFTRVSVRVGGAPTRLVVTLHPAAGGDPLSYSNTVERASDYRDVEILLPAPVESSRIRLEIETVGEGEPTHVHVYEVRLEGEGWKNGVAAPSS